MRIRGIFYLYKYHLTSKVIYTIISCSYIYTPSYGITYMLRYFQFSTNLLPPMSASTSLSNARIFSRIVLEGILRFWWISLYFIRCCVNGEYTAQTRHFNCFCTVSIFEVVKGNLKMK